MEAATGTAASFCFMPDQKASKSSGTGRLRGILVGSIAAPAMAETARGLLRASSRWAVTLSWRNPGSPKEPMTVALPSTTDETPFCSVARPSFTMTQSIRLPLAGLPFSSTDTVNVTFSPT